MSIHRFLDAESIAQIWIDFRVTKWPLNDLNWPLRTWKINFLTISHFGACIMSLDMFFERWVDCPRVSQQMTYKWPLNDLKWFIRTWKHNFLTKSHFGACNMSFYSLRSSAIFLEINVVQRNKGKSKSLTLIQIAKHTLRSTLGTLEVI